MLRLVAKSLEECEPTNQESILRIYDSDIRKKYEHLPLNLMTALEIKEVIRAELIAYWLKNKASQLFCALETLEFAQNGIKQRDALVSAFFELVHIKP